MRPKVKVVIHYVAPKCCQIYIVYARKFVVRTSFSDISTLRMYIPLVAYYEEIILPNSQLCQFSRKVAAKVHPKRHSYLSLKVVGLPQFNP
jgi:hypothetical protein